MGHVLHSSFMQNWIGTLQFTIDCAKGSNNYNKQVRSLNTFPLRYKICYIITCLWDLGKEKKASLSPPPPPLPPAINDIGKKMELSKVLVSTFFFSTTFLTLQKKSNTTEAADVLSCFYWDEWKITWQSSTQIIHYLSPSSLFLA